MTNYFYLLLFLYHSVWSPSFRSFPLLSIFFLASLFLYFCVSSFPPPHSYFLLNLLISVTSYYSFLFITIFLFNDSIFFLFICIYYSSSFLFSYFFGPYLVLHFIFFLGLPIFTSSFFLSVSCLPLMPFFVLPFIFEFLHLLSIGSHSNTHLRYFLFDLPYTYHFRLISVHFLLSFLFLSIFFFWHSISFNQFSFGFCYFLCVPFQLST